MDISMAIPEPGIIQNSGSQFDNNISSPVLLQENDQANRLQEEQNINVQDHYSIGHLLSPVDIQMTPGIMNFLEFDTTDMPISLSCFDIEKVANTPMAFSEEQLSRMRRLWPRRNPKSGTRLIRSLWHSTVLHQADNIFSEPRELCESSIHTALSRRQTSKWYMDDDCRNRLFHYCEELDRVARREECNDIEPHLSPLSSASSSWDSNGDFPTTELLDSSLDFFFHLFHPNLPFLHKSTFNAKTTPSSLLFPMCLVGLFTLDLKRTKPFVLRYLKKLMLLCRSDLTSKAVGQCPPWELLMTLASTLVVVYLALGLLDEVGECQAHMLCAQMLHIAEKHGLFAADHDDDLATQLQSGSSDPESSWKAWARVESIKRMILYLIWLDMAYTRLMSTAGVVEMDKVELHLPCEDILFEASSSATFFQAAAHGAELTMQRMRVRTLHTAAPSLLTHISIQTLIRVIYLQIAATCTRLLAENSGFLDAYRLSPAGALATDNRSKEIIKSILLIPTMYTSLIQGGNAMTALAWNELCLTLTADLDLLEIASGRDGLEAASTALVDVAKWSRSATARRAILHAAEVFDILDSSRIRELHIAKPEILLFVSALVLSLYLFVTDSESLNTNLSEFDLSQRVDWAVVNGMGLVNSTVDDTSRPLLDSRRRPGTSDAVSDFIQYGGPVSFAGEFQQGGGVAARKLLLKYAHLLDDFSKSDGSRYSQLLRTMSDFVIKDVEEDACSNPKS